MKRVAQADWHELSRMVIQINLCVILLTLSSCVTLKAWERGWLEDPDMGLGSGIHQTYELNSVSYREAASGANGAHSGGGCGCN